MGPLASIVREPGQVRKEAAEANDLSAEMWLVRPPPFLLASASPIKNISTLASTKLNTRVTGTHSISATDLTCIHTGCPTDMFN